MPLVEPALRAAVMLALLGAVGLTWYLDRPSGRWAHRARQRLIMGIPWGTLVSAAFVFVVYMVLQWGATDWHDPLTLPFYSWSYFYPLGVVLAPFSHMGPGHLTGNLLGTLLIAPIAEYAWSHFPVRRGDTAFATWRSNPYVRAFVIFPFGVVLVGVLTSLLHWGPVIGFSGVVYAFAGFGLVRYPLSTVLAVLLERFVDAVYDTLRNPIVEAQASPGFQTPWFVDIAVQGHLVGLLLGATLGIVVVVHRSGEPTPSAIRIGTATALFGTLFSPLWALWWIRGPDTYVLHRGAGILLLVGLAILLAVAAHASDREFAWGVSQRTVGVLVLVFPILVMAGVAVPINATVVDGPPPANGSVTVRDYTVTYAEGVTRPKTRLFDIHVLGESPEVVTGGVIVTSDDRELWARRISPGRLAFEGRISVSVGGLGWRERVEVRRVGWSLLNGGSAYQVWLRAPGEQYRSVYTSEPATAGVVLSSRNVSLRPTEGTFEFVVRRDNRTLGRTRVPGPSNVTAAGGIRFIRAKSTVIAAINGTRVPIAERDTGN